MKKIYTKANKIKYIKMGSGGSKDKTSTTVSPIKNGNSTLPIVNNTNDSHNANSSSKASNALKLEKKDDTPVALTELTPLELTRKLHTSIRWNKNIDEMKEIMEIEGNAAEQIDPQNGNRAIHIAAQNGHKDIVQILINKGCDINVKNMKGNTPLHMAIGYDYYSTAVLLINSGAQLEALNNANIPASKGLEGDKSLAANAVASAVTFEEYSEGLKLLKNQIPRGMTKESFIKYGLKIKKLYINEWNNNNIQTEFTNLLHDWEPQSINTTVTPTSP